MNPGGVRADLTFAPARYGGRRESSPAGRRSRSSRSTTSSPRSRSRAPSSLEVLKDQWCGAGQTAATVLLPSASLDVLYDLSVATSIIGRPLCERGEPGVRTWPSTAPTVDPAARTALTTNNFLADGGDGFLDAARGDRADVAERLRRRFARPLPRADHPRARRAGAAPTRDRITRRSVRQIRHLPCGGPCATAAR